MRKTAVEWLESEMLKPNLGMKEILEQAKEMEKQQIINSYADGYSDSDNSFELNKDYYNEKFKNK